MNIQHTPYPSPQESASATAIASVDQLFYLVNKRAIVQNVSFAVEPREILTIIGPNGCGKTTLAKLLLKLLKPTHGTIWHKTDLKIGYVPQKIHIESVFPLSVERFLELAIPASFSSRASAKAVGFGAKSSNLHIHLLAEEMGIGALLSSQMHVLSGGELQKVLLTQALLGSPSLLVLDEPVQGMDIQAQKQFYALIDRLRHERGCSVLMISHDLHMVMKSSDRVLCMHHHICCEGKPDDVRAHPEYRQLFHGEDLENIAVYRHHHDHVHDAHGECKHD